MNHFRLYQRLMEQHEVKVDPSFYELAKRIFHDKNKYGFKINEIGEITLFLKRNFINELREREKKREQEKAV